MCDYLVHILYFMKACCSPINSITSALYYYPSVCNYPSYIPHFLSPLSRIHRKKCFFYVHFIILVHLNTCLSNLSVVLVRRFNLFFPRNSLNNYNRYITSQLVSLLVINEVHDCNKRGTRL